MGSGSSSAEWPFRGQAAESSPKMPPKAPSQKGSVRNHHRANNQAHARQQHDQSTIDNELMIFKCISMFGRCTSELGRTSRSQEALPSQPFSSAT